MPLPAKPRTIKLGKEPLVIVPLSLWRKFEDYLEDQEALASPRYLRRIQKARADLSAGKTLYPFQ
jgi:PHD/YefM family antitoxin component YafN of YafNO toxin-antitoxin module